MEITVEQLMREIDEQLAHCGCSNCEELRAAKERLGELLRPTPLDAETPPSFPQAARVRARSTRGRRRGSRHVPAGAFTAKVVDQLTRGPQTATEVAHALGVSPQRTYGPLQRLVTTGHARSSGKPITFELIAAEAGSMAA